MKESEVWQLAREIWEKREKINLAHIEIYNLPSREKDDSPWRIQIYFGMDDSEETFTTTAEVRRFLDGLE